MFDAVGDWYFYMGHVYSFTLLKFTVLHYEDLQFDKKALRVFGHLLKQIWTTKKTISHL